MLNELKGLLFVGSAVDLLNFMRAHGSSVLLNWGEDDNLWECSWITGGERFTEVSLELEPSVRRCGLKVFREMEARTQPTASAGPESEDEREPDRSSLSYDACSLPDLSAAGSGEG